MKVIILGFLFIACQAVPMDLSGKMFVFPVASTTTAHVQLLPEATSGRNFNSVTVCLRFITDLTRKYVLFSMASRADANDFLIFKEGNKHFDVLIRGEKASFYGIPTEQNTWYSVCGTWDGNSGLVQLWSNGSPSTKKAGFKGTLDREPFIVLGQEQDSVGGGFDASQSFEGMITDVHMWNHVLSPCEIHGFTNNRNFTPGNVINWRALESISTSTVVLDNNQPTGCYHE